MIKNNRDTGDSRLHHVHYDVIVVGKFGKHHASGYRKLGKPTEYVIMKLQVKTFKNIKYES